MISKPEEAKDLREWREWKLRLSQSRVAMLAGCQQAWISQIERGHLPRPISDGWKRVVHAYGLDRREDQFIRLVEAGGQRSA
ncbi:MAG: helix-turn-helix transcriptional regulator [Bryobacteraceae bacterium]